MFLLFKFNNITLYTVSSSLNLEILTANSALSDFLYAFFTNPTEPFQIKIISIFHEGNTYL